MQQIDSYQRTLTQCLTLYNFFVLLTTKTRKQGKSLCLHIANYVIEYIVQSWFAMCFSCQGKTVQRQKGKVL